MTTFRVLTHHGRHIERHDFLLSAQHRLDALSLAVEILQANPASVDLEEVRA